MRVAMLLHDKLWLVEQNSTFEASKEMTVRAARGPQGTYPVTVFLGRHVLTDHNEPSPGCMSHRSADAAEPFLARKLVTAA